MDQFSAARIGALEWFQENAYDINEQNGWGHTSLYIASGRNNDDVCAHLLASGAQVDMRSRTGETALMLASGNGNAHVCSLLIAGGASIDIKDNDDNTALIHAAKNNRAKVCRLLLSHGANFCDQKDFSNDIISGCRYIYCKRTALICASKRGYVDICELLLRHGAPVDIRHRIYGSALEMASGKGHLPICSLLLSYGAQLEPCALLEAVYKGRSQVCKLLLSHGAQMRSARQVAFKRQHIIVIVVLEMFWQTPRTLKYTVLKQKPESENEVLLQWNGYSKEIKCH